MFYEDNIVMICAASDFLWRHIGGDLQGTLTDKAFEQGAIVTIRGFQGEPLILERLHEMGLRIGTEIKILRRLPFGGALLIRFQNSFLALRQKEAACALAQVIL